MLKQHILVELQHFIQSVISNRSNAKRLTAPSLIRTSLHILEDLPAAREIVFEYIALVAEVAVQNYVANPNVDVQTGLPLQQPKGGPSVQVAIDEDPKYFGPIQEALENLLSKGPTAWSPLIATWSLDLVGSLSDKYMKRKMPIGAACNFWLNCDAMRGLLTLISICFRKLNFTEVEGCVETLLATFQRYPISFDWVIARLGGCFPLKIISQILQFCLKRFMEDFRCRLDSEVGILEYLTFAHEQEFRLALTELLKEGFQPKKNLDASIIPFVLVLANYSDALLQSIVSVFFEIYNEDLLETIVSKAPLWMSVKPFTDMQPSLNNMVLRLKSKGASLLITTATMADQFSWCQDFLEYSLQELEQIVLNAMLCPLMEDLATEESKQLLWKSCRSMNLFEQQTAVRLLLIISTQHSHIYYQTISELLRKNYDTNPNALGALLRVIGGQTGIVNFPDIKPGLRMVLEDVLLQEQFPNSIRLRIDEEGSEALNTFKNLNMLIKMQRANSFSYMSQNILVNTITDCLPKILQILEVTLSKIVLRMDGEAANNTERRIQKLHNNFNNNALEPSNAKKKKYLSFNDDFVMECVDDNAEEREAEKHLKRLQLSHTIVDILNTIEVGCKQQVLRTTDVLKLSVLSVRYFFIALTEKVFETRSAAVNRALVLLHRHCCARKAARTACLRELIEGALFYHGYLFGQYEEPAEDELAIPDNEMVLFQNQRHSIGPNVNRTALHAGLIGRGLRPGFVSDGDGCDAKAQNLLLRALDACSADAEKQNSTDAHATIALLLVELVSPDVMYNGLPFPDEEFTKVTIERDLLIRRAFITSPVLWGLLGYISTSRPALCFCSVLLRALCATCLHQWRAKNVNKIQPAFTAGDELMKCTKKMLQILAMGQLLPPPLSSLHMIIEHFEATEIALLLKECVWNYLKENIPSPALFQIDSNGVHWRNPQLSKVPPQYIDTLRNLMQKKLSKLGQYYHEMFIMSEMITHDSSDSLNVGEIIS